MKNKKNRIRVIGGRWGGRYITFKESIDLRPTADRVRETLFNWLGQQIQGMICLDLFAGSGSLGFESASRGAELVVFVEKENATCEVLRENVESFSNKNLEVYNIDAIKFCYKEVRTFDLVFLDPPFGESFHVSIWNNVSKLVHPGSLVYIEANHKVEWPECYHQKRKSKAGQVFYALLEYRPS